MSASTKKKLRNEANAAKVTERQLAEQAEAKKVKIYTIAFVVVLAAILVTAVTVGIFQTIRSTGMMEKNTVAMTVGDHEISNAELNYYYIDTVNNFYSQNGSYAAMFGLDVTKPLDEQFMDETTGQTWADYFLASAKDTVKSIYALNDAAAAAGHTLSEQEQLNVESIVSYNDMYATLYGYADGEAYLKAMYGNGADMEDYHNYIEMSLLADSYYNAYSAGLTYEDADLRAEEAENFHAFSSFTYNYYYLAASRFLEGGTTDENGNVTYSDEEKAASVAAAEEAAKLLTADTITSVEALDAAISGLSINAESASAVSTFYEDTAYASIAQPVAEWLCDEARQEGDVAYVANTSGETVNGYYVLYFHGINDNSFALKNARHILLSYEGGTTDEYGNTVYSDEEKAAAMEKAEAVLADWEAGEATEDSFSALVIKHSTDPGSIENGGLYEDIYPGQMVTAFEDWCYDSSRKVGDTGIVETEYGCHVMYFSGDSETTYRDFQITNKLVSDDVNEWYSALLNDATVTEGNLKYINTSLVLSR